MINGVIVSHFISVVVESDVSESHEKVLKSGFNL